LDQRLALPCDQDGNTLILDTPPPPRSTAPQGDWSPFDSEIQFKLADLLYRRAELSTTNVDTLLDLWARSLADLDLDAAAPFRSYQEMLSVIDSSMLGDVPWQCMVTGGSQDINEHTPSWMKTNYEVWYRDPDTVVSMMLRNPDFEGQFDFRPYVDIGADGKRRWNNLMSGNIAWRRCVSHIISQSTAEKTHVTQC
jgi:hypothetical protein